MKTVRSFQWLVTLFVSVVVSNSLSVAAAAELKVLSGHRPAAMVPLSAVGDLPASTNLSLAISLPLHNTNTLHQRIAEIHDRSSANYGHHLTREQFTEQFGPTEEEYQRAINYAEAHGLTVTTTYKNRLMFDVTGSVTDIEKVFHLRLRFYPHPTENRHFFGPDHEPSVEPEFGILNVIGLDNFGLPHPLDLKLQSPGTNNVQTFSRGGSGMYGGLIGNDYRNAYAPGVTLSGSGQSVAIVSFTAYYPPNITRYQQLIGLQTLNITNVAVNGFNKPATNGIDDGETAMDIEMVMSMAPSANIMVYEGNNMYDMYNQIASDNIAKQVTCSFGVSGPFPTATFVNILNELNAQGQTAFIASGDSGADHLSYGEPGGYPGETICGGVDLRLAGQGGGRASETVWNGSGGGYYTNFTLPDYQQGISMTANRGSTSYRNIPDVAMPSINLTVISGSPTNFILGGGTSAASPLWAGFMALINEQRACNGVASVGNLNELLYPIGKGPKYTSAFNDVTLGNNTNGNPNNYFAVSAYDLCTGWGTPNGTNLINLLAQPNDPLQITPGFGFITNKVYGSTGINASVTFTLTNSSSSSVSWYVANYDDWLHIPSSGTIIPAHGSTTATISLTGYQDELSVGTHTSYVTFTDSTTGVSQNRLFTFTVSAAAQPLSLSGYNASIIVPTNGTISQPHASTFGIGSTVALYQAGLPGSIQGEGLPVDGRFTSAWDGQTIFQLGPYNGNNVLLLGNSYANSGTLTLSTPQSLNSIVVLATSAFASSTNTGLLTVHFTDGSSRNFNYYAPDWFNTISNSAIQSVGRINLSTFAVEDDGSNPHLYQTTIPLPLDSSRTVSSITFNMPSGATNTAIFAVSGVGGDMSGLIPTITQQPQSLTNLIPSSPEAFTVGVSGAAPFSYQWLSNGIPLPYGVFPSLNFDPNTPTSAAATYSVQVQNQYGTVTSSGATLSFYRSKPQITQQPTPSSVQLSAGSTLTLTGSASNLVALQYAWQCNGSIIAGATNATLVLATIQTNNSGSYNLIASNIYGAVTSAPAVVTITPTLPVITQNPTPANLLLVAGGSFTISGAATSAVPPVAYSWVFNGSAISGATKSTYSRQNLSAADSGLYSLVASNRYGAVTSAPAVVTISTLSSAIYPNTVLGLKPIGYWRLGESNGTTAFDSIGGYNGIYTNAVLGKSGHGTSGGTGTEPTQMAAQFGPTNSYVIISNVDVSVPNGGNGEFAIAAWVLASNTVPSAAGIFEKGYGGGDEEFGLTCGAPGSGFQFFVRNAATATPSVANSSVHPDNQWHFLVGVCDQSNSIIKLYVDGTNAAQASIAAGTGIHLGSIPASIGARTSASGKPYDLQFLGRIDDAAIFTNALSVTQITSLYNVSKYAPVITQQPQAVLRVNRGSTVTNVVLATGATLSYQWYGPSGLLIDATNNALVLTNLDFSQAGDYYAIVTNIYGTLETSDSFLHVLATNAPFPNAVASLNPLAFWRLDETNGTTAYDYINSNDGTYTNVVLGQPGYGSSSGTDSPEVAAQFGLNNTQGHVTIPSVDLSVANGGNGEFSIGAWVLASNTVSSAAGIAARGAGGGDEEFGLTCGANGNAFQFFVRSALFASPSIANSSVYPDNQWHFLMGVCDEAGGKVTLYVDGTNAAQASITAGTGIHASSIPTTIGARMSSSGSQFDDQFLGLIENVVIFTNAVSSAQVASLYNAVKFAPRITQQPPVWHGLSGDSVTNQVVATGSSLAYQWYGPSGLIQNATNSSLVLTNIAFPQQGNYYVVLTNTYGVLESDNAFLTVAVTNGSFPDVIMGLEPISYLRLNETNGTTAFDLVGGNDGTYTNVILGQPGYDSFEIVQTDPEELAAQFGPTNGALSYVTVPNIDFSTPWSTYKAFTIAAWVQAPSNVPAGAGIVAKGYGGGDEQFGLTCGANGNAFQFFARGASGVAFIVNSHVYPDDRWHWVVGVCDEFNGYVSLYVDGVLAGQTAIHSDSGIHFTAVPTTIGARASGNGTPFDLQFTGLIDDVAFFDKALSASQVITAYGAARPAPAIYQQPGNVSALVGGSATNQVAASGVGLAYQWYGPAGAIDGATNSSLVLTNLQLSQRGPCYVVITNKFGSVQSSSFILSVNAVFPNTMAYAHMVQTLNPLAFWRLDETNGSIAKDYAGPNDGTYTNVLLGQPGYDSSPNVLAAQFGVTNGLRSYVTIPTIDLSTPVDSTSTFTIAIWVKASPLTPASAGIISKGYGAGDEQFCMDCGGTNNAFRFFVGDARLGGAYIAPSSVIPDNQWHFLVGVCDSPHQTIALYVDGTNAVTRGMNPRDGTHFTSVPATIGARPSGPGQPPNLQFIGEIDGVAIFPTALSVAQAQALFYGAGPSIAAGVLNGQVTLNWPDAAGYQLEYKTNLSDAVWLTNSVSVTVTNGVDTLTLPMNGATKFFRLHKP